MVVHRAPAAIDFNRNGCQLACCAPGGRKELTTIKKPLPLESRLAFLLVVRRLGASSLPGLRALARDVLERIFELSETTERRIITIPALPGLPQHARRGGPSDDTDPAMDMTMCGLAI